MAKTYRDINELKEGARTACRTFLNACQSAGLDVFLTETYRSQERQNELYAQGRTKPGKVVTWTTKSNHTSRQAWDISFTSTGYDELSKFYKAGKIAEDLNITWGGNWKTPDYSHFEFKGEKYVAPATSEARSLVNLCYSRGWLTNKEYWLKCFTGEETCSDKNLRALIEKILKNS